MKTALVSVLIASSAWADAMTFGANDIVTAFYFDKSDDKNRIDYGVRLDANCKPVGDEPVVPYWREFETSAGKNTATMKFFEYPAYGVAEQKIKGNEIKATMKAVPREIVITTSKGEDGKCKAVSKTDVAKARVEFKSAYIKLKSGWSVDYVELRGVDAAGKGVTEKLTP